MTGPTGAAGPRTSQAPGIGCPQSSDRAVEHLNAKGRATKEGIIDSSVVDDATDHTLTGPACQISMSFRGSDKGGWMLIEPDDAYHAV